MTSKFTAWVWEKSGTTDTQRLVMLALADHADWKGRVAMSVREIADLCRISKSRAGRAINDLVQGEELEVVYPSAGRGNPATYRLTMPLSDGTISPAKRHPDPEIVPTARDKSETGTKAAPDPEAKQDKPLTQTVEIVGTVQDGGRVEFDHPPSPETPIGATSKDVFDILEAAGVVTNTVQPFYWYRREHRVDLDAILRRTQKDMPALLDAIRQARQRGIRPEGQIARLTQLDAMWSRANG